jgi:hypothetical protein
MGRATTPGNSVSYSESEHEVQKGEGEVEWKLPQEKKPSHHRWRLTLHVSDKAPIQELSDRIVGKWYTDHADVGVPVDERAQHIHLLV